MTRIGLSPVATTDISEIDVARQTLQGGGPEFLDRESLSERLEKIADPDKPMIIKIFGVRELDDEGSFTIRECRSILGYKSSGYLKLESERAEAERKAEAERTKQARLDQFRSQVRQELREKELMSEAADEGKKQRERMNIESSIEAEARKRFASDMKKSKQG